MVYLVYVFFMVAAGAAVVLLAGSDALINLSAASVVGSTPESVSSAKAVAVGVVLASVSLGAMSRLVHDKGAQAGIWFGVFLVGAVSATFTIQGVSVDYAANDQSGVIQGARQDGNSRKISEYQEEKKKLERTLKDKQKSCAKYDRWYSCNKTESRIAELTSLISTASDDNVDSVASEQIDISESVYEKTGIPGWLLERAVIYSRAIALPFVIALVTHIFFHLLTLLFGELRAKKPVAVPSNLGAAVVGAVENKLNGKRPTTPQKPKAKAKKSTPRPTNVVDIKSQSSTPQTTPQKAPLPNRSPAKPRGSKDRSVSGVPGEKSKVALPNNLDQSKLTDGERFAVVEYLVQRKSIKPSFNAIKTLGIGSTNAQKYLERLRTRGTIVKGGRGHTLVASRFIAEPVAKFEKLIKAA